MIGSARWHVVGVLGLLASVSVGCNAKETPLPLVGTLERDRLELVADARERIVVLNVTEGQRVTEGDVLAQLETRLIDAQLAEAHAIKDREARRLAELVRGPRRERIAEAQAHLTGAIQQLELQQREHARISNLVDEGVLSAADLDSASESQVAAEAQRDESRARLDELLEGTTSEEVGQAQAALAAAEASAERLGVVRDRLTVRAPISGVVEALPYELGERPPAGAAVVIMLTDSAPRARVYVPQEIRARVRPGMAATVFVDGLEREFVGTVRFVGSEAAFTPYYALTQRDRSRLVYLAEVTLTEDEARDLPSGMPVEVDFAELR